VIGGGSALEQHLPPKFLNFARRRMRGDLISIASLNFFLTTTSMAPTRIRARAARAANKDPRGRYAPPEDSYQELPEASAAESLPSILKANTPASHSRHHTDDNAAWRLNKRDKRTIKHNSLLAKVRDGGIQKPSGKTRRPAKKLKADIGGLADALPDIDDDHELVDSDEEGWEGISGDEENGDVSMAQPGTATKKRRRRKPAATSAQGKMIMTSLKHRPGAMKKKMVLEGREMERFQKNLAVMVGGSNSGQAGSASRSGTTQAGSAPQQADRWAALRGFISNTMVQNKAFAGA
jgi:hypothetical protein